jgi:succinate dehydrogenase flavin-adding protein (antitoxin of CptAB toxin-antitoxin module)
MNNPFPYETIAPKEFFYGRENEINLIKEHIKNSTNLLLFSKRRMGKSTLVKNCFEVLSDEYTTLYVDIFNIITAEDFASQLLKVITAVQKNDILEAIKKYSSLLKRVRVEPTFNPQTGNMSIKPIVTSLTFEEMIDDAFSLLFELSKEKKVVLAIDEFQQISTIKQKKIDALLRKYMQENYPISYIFLGSKRNTLNALFTYKAPLYSMAMPLALDSIDINDVYKYAVKHLSISKQSVEYIYFIAKGETKLIQMILHRIFNDKINKAQITKEYIDSKIDILLEGKSEYYKTIFETLSTNQKKAFRILVNYDDNLLSKDVLKSENISAPSMQSSLTQLYQKEYIDKSDDIYFIPDRSFELWGKKFL